MTGRYPYVEVTIAPEAEDAATGILLAAGATGLETRDGGTLVRPAGGETVLVGFFDSPGDAREAHSRVRRGLGEACSAIVVGAAEDPGWRLAWRRFFGPMRFGRRLWVAPPDEPPGLAPGEVVVSLVPSGAFGTGTHETTALILELLDELVRPGHRVLDVGTGSGILALAALRLGATRALGIDLDPEAVEAARGNADVNGLGELCSFDDRAVDRVEGSFDLVLANLSFKELPPVVGDLAKRVAPGGALVWSGLLVDEVGEVPPPDGFVVEAERRRGGWAARVLRAAPGGR